MLVPATTVPVTIIGDHAVRGYDPAALKRALAEHPADR